MAAEDICYNVRMYSHNLHTDYGAPLRNKSDIGDGVGKEKTRRIQGGVANYSRVYELVTNSVNRKIILLRELVILLAAVFVHFIIYLVLHPSVKILKTVLIFERV